MSDSRLDIPEASLPPAEGDSGATPPRPGSVPLRFCDPQATDFPSDLAGPIPMLSSRLPLHSSHTPLTRVVDDDRAIGRLLDLMISRAGLTLNETANRLGVSRQTLQAYVNGRAPNPSLRWMLRLCSLCGAEIQIKLPEKQVP
jgi:DNA-binding XRE family transcriptional regulator